MAEGVAAGSELLPSSAEMMWSELTLLLARDRLRPENVLTGVANDAVPRRRRLQQINQSLNVR